MIGPMIVVLCTENAVLLRVESRGGSRILFFERGFDIYLNNNY